MTAARLAEPFTSGVEKLVASMLGVECRQVEEGAPPAAGSISGVITLSGTATLEVALTFPRETASLLVAEMIGIELDEVDDEILTDGVGEIANIVAGNAKAELGDANPPFLLSLPRVIAGAEVEPHTLAAAARHFDTDLGPFSMYVSLAPPAPDRIST